MVKSKGIRSLDRKSVAGEKVEEAIVQKEEQTPLVSESVKEVATAQDQTPIENEVTKVEQQIAEEDEIPKEDESSNPASEDTAEGTDENTIEEQSEEESSATVRPIMKKKKVEKEKQAVIDYLPAEYDDADTKLRQVARPDLPRHYYGYDSVNTNFKLYNGDLDERLTLFSKRNQRKGGVAITKAQVIETCLDFIMYDMKLDESGPYSSTEDIREYLRTKLK